MGQGELAVDGGTKVQAQGGMSKGTGAGGTWCIPGIKARRVWLEHKAAKESWWPGQ